MRRSLLVRLVALSLAVASLGIVATALLATYSTGSELREEAADNTALLETDARIRSVLLDYARENADWQGVAELVRELSQQTGRRIALTDADGTTIVDSADLAGDLAAGLPAVPSAEIDAASPVPPSLQLGGEVNGGAQLMTGIGSGVGGSAWRLTESERRERDQALQEVTSCLEERGITASFDFAPEGEPAYFNHQIAVAGEDADDAQQAMEDCVPDSLNAPSAMSEQVNAEAVRLQQECLDERGLPYTVGTDVDGLAVVQPADDSGPSLPTPEWEECLQQARHEALRPHVAPPARLYLGTDARFSPLSAEGAWRTAGTTAVILLVAAAITVVAGRRLVRPIRALTGAAQRMEAGDHSTRVHVNGSDEVTRLAHAFNAMAESLQAHDRQRKALVSDVAHELRNPLANVRGQLEAAEDGVLPLDGALVASLLEESQLLERLVADLHELALADAGMLRVHLEERDAADLAQQVVAAHRGGAEEAGVRLALSAAGPVPVLADPARLRQALGNLVANAVRHTPHGGSVTVAVRAEFGEVRLSVRDTGVGIPADQVPHLFDRFYRGDPSRSRATGGSGLGLAITKHLVEAHGGRVTVASTPGEGTEFTIALPDGGWSSGRPAR